MMNSLDYQNTRFSRQMGETWLRPNYANYIEHYRPNLYPRWTKAAFIALLTIVTALGVIGAVV